MSAGMFQCIPDNSLYFDWSVISLESGLAACHVPVTVCMLKFRDIKQFDYLADYGKKCGRTIVEIILQF